MQSKKKKGSEVYRMPQQILHVEVRYEYMESILFGEVREKEKDEEKRKKKEDEPFLRVLYQDLVKITKKNSYFIL